MLKKNAMINRIKCRTNIEKGQEREICPASIAPYKSDRRRIKESFCGVILSEPRLVGREQTIGIQIFSSTAAMEEKKWCGVQVEEKKWCGVQVVGHSKDVVQ